MSGNTSRESSIVPASERALARTSSLLAERGLALVEELALPKIVRESEFCVITPDNVGQLRELARWEPGYPVTAWQVGFSPDARRLAVIVRWARKLGGKVVGGKRQAFFDIECDSGIHLAALAHGSLGPLSERDVDMVAFAPGGHLLALAGYNGGVWVGGWEEDQGLRLVGELEPRARGRCIMVHAVGFYDDETLVLACGDQLQWWNVRRRSRTRGGPFKVLDLDYDSAVPWPVSMAFSPNARVVAACLLDRTVHVWRTRDGARLASLGRLGPDQLHGELGHACAANGVMAFSRDGNQFALGCQDGTVLVLSDLEQRGRLQEAASVADLQGPEVGYTGRRCLDGVRSLVRSLAFSPDGRTLVAACERGSCIAWAVPSGDMLGNLPLNLDSNCLAFSPDGRLLAIGLAFWGGAGLWGVTAAP